jgi:hypothetical protein
MWVFIHQNIDVVYENIYFQPIQQDLLVGADPAKHYAKEG